MKILEYITKYFLVLSLLLVNVSTFAYGTSRILGNTQNMLGTNNAKIIAPSIPALGTNYEFILFYGIGCTYCAEFGPILKVYSDNTSISVRAFVIGKKSGEISPSFPNSILVSQDVVDQFFGIGAKVALPTLFILNKNSLHAYPVSRGALTYLELAARMSELTSKILQNERGEYKK